MRNFYNLFLGTIFIAFFSMPMLIHANEIEPAKKSKRPSFVYKPELVRRTPKYEQKLGILPIIDSRASMFYGEEDDFYKDPIIVGLNRIFNLELRYSGLFAEVASIKDLSSVSPDIREIQSIGASNKTNLILLTYLTDFNFNRTPADMYSTMGGWQVDFANSVKLSFICQIIDVDTGLILFAEEISRESIEYAKSGSFEMNQLQKMTIDALKSSFTDLKILIQENGLRLK